MTENKKTKLKTKLPRQIKEPQQPCDICLDVLNNLKTDHGVIIEHVNDFKNHLESIQHNTKDMVDALKEFHDDNREYVKLIAGKRQVPISIFAIIVVLLVTLLVASEVRYSKLDISVGDQGIHVSPPKTNTILNETENN